jgi:hypothetical protein
MQPRTEAAIQPERCRPAREDEEDRLESGRRPEKPETMYR